MSQSGGVMAGSGGMSGGDKASMFIQLGDRLHQNFNQTFGLISEARTRKAQREMDKERHGVEMGILKEQLYQTTSDRKRLEKIRELIMGRR